MTATKGSGGGGGATTFGQSDPAAAAKKVREAASFLNQALYEAFAAGVRCEVSADAVRSQDKKQGLPRPDQIVVNVRCWRDV